MSNAKDSDSGGTRLGLPTLRALFVGLVALACTAAAPVWGDIVELSGQTLTATDLGGGSTDGAFGFSLAVGDFDGDGFRDVAVGAPGTASASGAVYVTYGSSLGPSAAGAQVFTQDTPGVTGVTEAGDLFGYAVAAGDFDGDGFDDLAVGVAGFDTFLGLPAGEDIGGTNDVGAVHVLYGSSSGLSASREQFFHQDTAGLHGINETSDAYGAALAAGDFDADGFDDLAVGVPGETLAGMSYTGMVAILRGSAAGLSTVGNGLIAQDLPDVLGTPASYEYFGRSLSTGDFNGDTHADLAVGILESPGGAVAIFYGTAAGLSTTGNQLWDQDDAGMLDIAEALDDFGFSVASDDFDADGFDDLAIGIPGEDYGGTLNGGAAQVLYGGLGGISATGNQLFSVDLLGVSPQPNDAFGTAVAGGDFDGDGHADLAVGAPGIDVCYPFFPCTELTNAGRTYLYRGAPGGLSDDTFRPVGPAASAGSRHGRALGSGDIDGDGFADLVVGGPGDASGIGDSILFFSGNTCGNGQLDPGEQCDDGDDESFDGCSNVCIVEFCGDGVLQMPLGEACDDGNNTAGDGCSANCSVEVCGDSVIQPGLGETCDDGNLVSLDGCSDMCAIESAITLTGDPQGGAVFFTVDGVPLSIATTDPLTLEQAAQAIALAINSDPTLTVLGVSAQAIGTSVYTNGTLTDVSTTDPGLTLLLSLPTECSDSVDNDADGATDLADSDCVDVTDPFEGVGVLDRAKISDTHGYLSAPGSPGSNPGALLVDGDQFGASVEGIGDLDRDGVPDVAVGALGDDTGNNFVGAVYILFLNADGTVKARQKIGEGTGGLLADLDDGDGFGTDVALIHDVDGDGVQDIAVAAPNDDDGGSNAGALYVLFLNLDGTVKVEQKISNLAGGLGAVNQAEDGFGNSPTSVGDLDGDGIPDVAVGSFLDNASGGNSGSLFILFLNADGTVKGSQKITEGVGGFTGTLDVSDRFGSGVANLGDLDGDGRPELAVGARFDGSNDAGVVYLLSLNSNGTVHSYVTIEGGTNGFVGPTDVHDRFAWPARIGDLNDDGVGDLAVGAVTDDDGGTDVGAVWILFLNSDGSIQDEMKLSARSSSMTGELDAGDLFGNGVSSPGDLDGDGVIDLIVGASRDDDGGINRGAAYTLFMDGASGVCGNGVLDPLELCDDGNTTGGDGCPADCGGIAVPEPATPLALAWGAMLLGALSIRRRETR